MWQALEATLVPREWKLASVIAEQHYGDPGPAVQVTRERTARMGLDQSAYLENNEISWWYDGKERAKEQGRPGSAVVKAASQENGR